MQSWIENNDIMKFLAEGKCNFCVHVRNCNKKKLYLYLFKHFHFTLNAPFFTVDCGFEEEKRAPVSFFSFLTFIHTVKY